MSITAYFLLTLSQTVIGLLYDRVVGDPQSWPHPARWIGRWIVLCEGWLRVRFSNLRLAGIILCWSTVLLFTLLSLGLMAVFLAVDLFLLHVSSPFFSSFEAIPWGSIVGGGLICGVWFSFRSLSVEAERVYRFLEKDDLSAARRALSMIVGRDTESLSAGEISRAAIESVAENSVDGGVSPVVFALLGGPAFVTFFKAASTLDSMVGYRDERYIDLGRMSARLDDALNYIPARLCLLLYPLAALWESEGFIGCLRIGLRDGRKHPSPNSAIGESLFAGALGLQLGGVSFYRGVRSEKPLLGEWTRPVEGNDILRANRFLRRLFLLLVTGMSLVIALLVLRIAGR